MGLKKKPEAGPGFCHTRHGLDPFKYIITQKPLIYIYELKKPYFLSYSTLNHPTPHSFPSQPHSLLPLSVMDSPSSPSLTHSHSRTQPQALTSVTPTITRSHYWPQALSLPVLRSSHVCFSLSLSSLSSDLSSPNVTQPRFATSAKISVLLLFFRFITWCLKGVLLCIFICGIYFVDF